MSKTKTNRKAATAVRQPAVLDENELSSVTGGGRSQCEGDDGSGTGGSGSSGSSGGGIVFVGGYGSSSYQY